MLFQAKCPYLDTGRFVYFCKLFSCFLIICLSFTVSCRLILWNCKISNFHGGLILALFMPVILYKLKNHWEISARYCINSCYLTCAIQDNRKMPVTKNAQNLDPAKLPGLKFSFCLSKYKGGNVYIHQIKVSEIILTSHISFPFWQQLPVLCTLGTLSTGCSNSTFTIDSAQVSICKPCVYFSVWVATGHWFVR